MSALRDRIAAIPDIPSETIEIEEWEGIALEVRGMSGKQRSKLVKKTADSEGRVNLEAALAFSAIECCFDPQTGEKVFIDGDAEMLLGKASSVLERISQVMLRLSGLDKDAESRLGKAISQAQSQNDPSTSGSAES